MVASPGRTGVQDIEVAKSHELELHFDRLFDRLYVTLGESPNTIFEPAFADGGDLVGHGLVLLPAHRHKRLARVDAVDIGRHGNDLNAVEMLVGSIIAHNDSG